MAVLLIGWGLIEANKIVCDQAAFTIVEENRKSKRAVAARGTSAIRIGARVQAPVETKLDAHRLLRSHRNRRQPVIAVRLLAANDAVKLCLQSLGHRAELALAHGNLVDRADGCDFSGGAGEENFVGDVQRLPRNLLLDDLDSE